MFGILGDGYRAAEASRPISLPAPLRWARRQRAAAGRRPFAFAWRRGATTIMNSEL
jgi:hypothetical protein